MYLGDDVTDEDAFRTLSARRSGTAIAGSADPEIAERSAAGEYVLVDTSEAQTFVERLV